MTTDTPASNSELPDEGNTGKAIRGALQVASGAVPVLGGALSAIAGAWSEREQAKVNQFFDQCVRPRRLKDEKTWRYVFALENGAPKPIISPSKTRFP